jgi:enoyl-CoA hydratase/carnithine racemase
MPEVTIGLYPDVGASWFLGAMPGRTGLFLGLTGASLNAADAMYAGLADFTMPDDKKSDLLDTISNAGWFGAQMADRDQLTDILANCNAVDDVPLSSLQILRARIDGVMQPDTLEQIAKRLRGLADDGEPWLSRAGSTFAKGSPSSVALTYELSNRSKQVSLAEVLRLEYLASIGCMMKSDFSEGVRALLVDKDKEPRWQPAVLDLVSRAHVEDHLVPRFKGEHPLADLN